MKMNKSILGEALRARFGETIEIPDGITGIDTLCHMAGRSTHRKFSDREIDNRLLKLLCACALSAPSKSDLQQADIVHVTDPNVRASLADLIGSMPWVASAPVFLVICGNGRRLRQISKYHDADFANDHLDALFNPTVDAGLVLANLLIASEAVGLKTCPISVVRNHCSELRDWLKLPELTFPVAGLCLGWPCEERAVVPRLPLRVTLHEGRHDDKDVVENIVAYDRSRGVQTGWDPDSADFEGWSQQRARMYSSPQRVDFGAFLAEQGFNLE